MYKKPTLLYLTITAVLLTCIGNNAIAKQQSSQHCKEHTTSNVKEACDLSKSLYAKENYIPSKKLLRLSLGYVDGRLPSSYADGFGASFSFMVPMEKMSAISFGLNADYLRLNGKSIFAEHDLDGNFAVLLDQKFRNELVGLLPAIRYTYNSFFIEGAFGAGQVSLRREASVVPGTDVVRYDTKKTR